MSARHFINDPTELVNTALQAVTITNPSLALDRLNKIIYRRPEPSSNASTQVAIISGGGAGHEPSFVAMVGKGLLSAAVSGTIFASPSSEQILTSIVGRVDNSAGVLIIVMNYTGDVLNFGVAVEKARARGINIEMVVVGDDVGVARSRAGKVGRRGIAGTVLVEKIAGALAARGYSLPEVARVTRIAASNLVSIGASLGRVHVPGRAIEDTDEEIPFGEVELGMGIHNEPGSGRETSALPDLVYKMLDQLLSLEDPERTFLKPITSDWVLLVNNLGGLSVLELCGITTEVVKQLQANYQISSVRVLNGTYMTSLNGPGFSISLLNLADTGIKNVSLLDLLDDPAEATGWSAAVSSKTWQQRNRVERNEEVRLHHCPEASGLLFHRILATKAIRKALENVVAAEPEITKYDTIVGDGDCGIGLRRGAEAIIDNLSKFSLTGDAVIDTTAITRIVEKTMDGTSGAIYAIFLNALIHSLQNQGSGSADVAVWSRALKQSFEAMSKYTPARPGDRTLVDALHPFIEVLTQTSNVQKASAAAKEGAEKTKGMKASLGRTVYIGGSNFEQVPDPGAWGLSCFLDGLASELA